MHEHEPTRVEICLSINGRLDLFVHVAPELARAVGIKAHFGEPVLRTQPKKEEDLMKCPVFKKSAMKKGMQATGDPAVGPGLVDNEDSTITVVAVDSAGNAMDVTDDTTITAVSSDTSTLSLDAPIDNTVRAHFLKATPPGKPVVVSITQTFASGKLGPFRVDLPAEITGSVQAGIVGVWGTPVVRP